MNNRILKFRVWDLKYKYYCTNLGFLGLDCDGILCNIQSSSIKNDYIIQQFTGLIDKNGKEIYEGDILEQAEEFSDCTPDDMDIDDERIIRLPTDSRSGLIFRGKIIGKVQFYDQAYRFKNNILGGCYKIIGNIFENPELLQKS